jgi:F420-non-reducing hydrogenase small subunit
MRSKIRMAMQNLSYCGGCEIALSDLGGELLRLLDESVDFVYGPLFMSAEDYEDVDVVLLTGAVRNEEDIEQIRKARERARYVVSFGSCASLGGIPGLANMFGTEHLLEAAFDEAPSVENDAARPRVRIPMLAAEIKPVEDYIKVDFVLDGCPPLPPMIGEFLGRLLAEVRAREV